MKKICVLSLLVIFTCGLPVLAANLQQTIQPTALGHSLSPLENVDSLKMPSVNLDEVLNEDKKRIEEGLPPRFAIPMKVQVIPGIPTLNNELPHKGSKRINDSRQVMGTWEKINEEIVVWRLRVNSPGALSLNFGFTRYIMPPKGHLFIYSPDYKHVLRPFTDQDNEEHGQLWTPIIFGDEVVIELTMPAKAINAFELELGFVNHDYKGFGRPLDKSGACNVDVICPEGDDWRDQIRSVAVYSTGGSLFCSGALINNTAEDNTPFFLTANHCGINTINAPSMVVYWNYETSTCGGTPDGQLNDFQTGAIFRASRATSDMTLVELDDPIDTAHNLFFSGWDRNGTNSASATAIHHPNCDEKRISIENHNLSTTSYLTSTTPGDGTHFRVADWDIGTTESGSSGSPLFDPNHRIVGQLHGGNAACGNELDDWYGKLSVSWIGGGSANTRLSDWLDPGNTGVTTLDGRNANLPAVDAFDVTPRSLVLGNAFSISYTVSDSGGTGLKQVELWRAIDTNGDGEPDWSTDPQGYIDVHYLSGQTSYSSSFSDTPTSIGTYWYGIHVVDNAGNWSVEPKPPGPIQVTVTKPPSCPSLYFWNGSDYKRRGFIIPGAIPRENEYIDHISLRQYLVLKDGQYYLQIRETEQENSFIDMVELIIVDHSSSAGTNAISILKEPVANSHSNTSETLYKGRSYTAKGSNVKSLSPVSAIHSKIGNVLQLLSYSDNTYVKMFPGDIITLIFPYVPLQDEERDFIFVGEGFYVPLIPR